MCALPVPGQPCPAVLALVVKGQAEFPPGEGTGGGRSPAHDSLTSPVKLPFPKVLLAHQEADCLGESLLNSNRDRASPNMLPERGASLP